MNFTAESSHTLVAERGLYKLYNCGGSTVSLASVVALPRASSHPWHTGLLQGGGEEALAAHINLVQNHCRHLGKSLYVCSMSLFYMCVVRIHLATGKF